MAGTGRAGPVCGAPEAGPEGGGPGGRRGLRGAAGRPGGRGRRRAAAGSAGRLSDHGRRGGRAVTSGAAGCNRSLCARTGLRRPPGPPAVTAGDLPPRERAPGGSGGPSIGLRPPRETWTPCPNAGNRPAVFAVGQQ